MISLSAKDYCCIEKCVQCNLVIVALSLLPVGTPGWIRL